MVKTMKNHMLVYLLGVIVFISGCASEPEEQSSTASQDGEEKSGGDLIISMQSDVVSLDPAGVSDVPSYDVQTNIFEKLISRDAEMELQPRLAKSWESIDDTTWEFELQEGVTYHDGSEFNADVVKANIDRVQDPDVAAPAANYLEMIEKVDIIDDHTIRIVTEYPFSALPDHFAHNVSSMVSKEQIEEDYAAMEEGEEPGTIINENPIGTGYFKFDSQTPGESVKLVKNDDYWDGEALLDSVTFKVISEDLTRLAELQTGDSHVTNPLSPSDIEELESSDEIHVTKQEGAALDFLGLNTQKEPFDDQLVRQAITMAIDKDQIIDGIYNGVAKPAAGPLSETLPEYDGSVEGMEYNVEKAKELLTEAGLEDGFSATIWTNDDRERVDMATNIQSQLEKVNIDIDIEIMEWGAFLERIESGKHDMYLMGQTYSNADSAVYPLFHSDNLGAAGNRVFLEDDELDALIEAGRKEMDDNKRGGKFIETSRRSLLKRPLWFIYSTKTFYSA